MLSRVNTVAFNGLEILDVDLQVQISSGLPAFTIVGLPDKAVAESRERVRAALQSLGLSLPAKRITLNLAPADLLKEGSHFDLPVALGLLAGMGVIPQEELADYIALGELGLDGSLLSVNGILPAAVKPQRQRPNLPRCQRFRSRLVRFAKHCRSRQSALPRQPFQRRAAHSSPYGTKNRKPNPIPGHE